MPEAAISQWHPTDHPDSRDGASASSTPGSGHVGSFPA
jgi:hypothetical protein